MAQRDRTKQRTREHVIEDLSLNYLERLAYKCNFIVDSSVTDYGIDARIYTVDAEGHVESDEILCQLKATDNLAMYLLADGETISFPIEKPDILLWTSTTFPVIFIVYDANETNEAAYWLYIQRYFANRGIVTSEIDTQTNNVRIPRKNRLNVEAIRQFREFKMSVQSQIEGKIDYGR